MSGIEKALVASMYAIAHERLISNKPKGLLPPPRKSTAEEIQEKRTAQLQKQLRRANRYKRKLMDKTQKEEYLAKLYPNQVDAPPDPEQGFIDAVIAIMGDKPRYLHRTYHEFEIHVADKVSADDLIKAITEANKWGCTTRVEDGMHNKILFITCPYDEGTSVKLAKALVKIA